MEDSMEDMEMEEATCEALQFHRFYATCRHYLIPSLFHHSPRSYFPKFGQRLALFSSEELPKKNSGSGSSEIGARENTVHGTWYMVHGTRYATNCFL
jgi:hypothetical protein